MANTCKKCAADVKPNQNGIGRELCAAWCHAKCVGITSDTYKYLKSCSQAADGSGDQCVNVNGGMMWFCMDCLDQASKIIKNISDIQKRQDDIEHELTKANTRMNTMELAIKYNRRTLETEAAVNKKVLNELQSVVSALEITLHDVQCESKKIPPEVF